MRLERVRIAARQSDLARLQAYRVGEALRESLIATRAEITFQFRASLGDINLNDPLWKMPEKGVFTEDFTKDLIEGAADVVVHSWKDLPTEARPSTTIAATLPRADQRDLLLFRRDRLPSATATGRVKILTSSPRRAHNLQAFLRDHLPFATESIAFESVRGNIPTRLKKMLAEDVDGLVVAKAALDRLLEAREPEFREVQAEIRAVLSRSLFMVLPLSANPTAAAQGALAIEISRSGPPELHALLTKLNCAETFAAVEKERRILAAHGGGCHQKIGVSILRRSFGEVTYLRGLTDSGQVLDSVELSPSSTNPRGVKAKGADAIFPGPGEEGVLFSREALDRSDWARAENERCLWVARETAWPEGFRAREDAVVWTAGLKSWRKLASRGVWVSGSAEGLGEEEKPRVEALIGPTKWLKLTHAASGAASGMEACATYVLRPKEVSADLLRGRTHFYWMSGSSFDRALELWPELRTSAQHACGPGLTHRHLVAKAGSPVAIYLSPEAWRKDVLRKDLA